MTIGISVTYIEEGTFQGCSSLENIDIPNSVTTIGNSAFADCYSLGSINIPNSVTIIGNEAFVGCYPLESINIPNSVTVIGDNVFYKCHNLKNVTIGNSVTYIGQSTFMGCTSLETIYSLNTTPPILSNNNFITDQYFTVNIFVPQESLSLYRKASEWGSFVNLQGFDPTGIESVKGDAINENNVYYDLRGNRLDAPKKGLNIINGKKVVVK